MYQRNILRINLSNRTHKTEELPPEYVREYVGGRSLGARLLYDEVTAGTDPLGEQNKLFVTLGPLQGTHASGSARHLFHCKSPQTLLYLMTLAGGQFGPAVARAGYQVIVLEGKSEKPVWLQIDNDKVHFNDAKSMWGIGLDTFACQEIIKEQIGRDYEIACIGPAGENQVLFAGIINARRAAARGGAGAVMGSKNVKAIAVRGTGKPPIADEEAFRKAVREEYKALAAHHATSEMIPKYGSNHMSETTQEIGGFPTRNFKQGVFEGFDKIGTETYAREYVIENASTCKPCSVKCSKFTVGKVGDYRGLCTEGPEYETVFSFGSNMANDNFSAIIAADILCDQMGLDSLSAGLSISFAIECFERGYITAGDTGGYVLRFGEMENILRMIRKIAFKEGFGEFLALGSQRMAEKIGKNTMDFAMHAKGLEFGGYDPRAVKGMALTYACGNRGGCHHAGGHTIFSEVLGGKMDRFSEYGKGQLVKDAREKRTIADSAVVCTFNMIGLTPDVVAGLLKSATGFEYSGSDLVDCADRGNLMERAFNCREGLRRKHDTLPRRLLKEPMPVGPAQGQTVHLEPLVDDFYNACGWDLTTGIPTRQKMESLGIPANVIEDMGKLPPDAKGFWVEHEAMMR